MNCTFTIPDQSDPRLKRCTTCGREVRTDVTPELCRATCRTPSKDKKISQHFVRSGGTLRLRHFSEMICDKRGDSLGFVPCGMCGQKDLPVPVALCSKHGVCSERPVANKTAQQVRVGEETIHPMSCVGCGEWHGPPEFPRKIRDPKTMSWVNHPSQP